MFENEVSRRKAMQLGLGAAAATSLLSTTGKVLPQPPPPASLGLPGNPIALRNSVNAAYAFLTQMMDAYAQGATTRLSQSYSDQIAGGTFFSTAFIYDNALLVLAYLARRTQQDTERAKVIGNALLYAQQHDPTPDGRFRQAYFAGV